MSRGFSRDFLFEVAKGNIPGHHAVNKFGQITNADAGVITDVWDAAAQPVWLPPTAARVHEILSTSDEDSDTGGAIAQGGGARTVEVIGLKTWDDVESSEIVIMDGTDGVDTVNSYVIVHRMEVKSSGILGPNAGLITAVAASDLTVTAQIALAGPNGKGQTEMAILGIPSTQRGFMENFSASLARLSPTGAQSGVILMETMDVLTQPSVFIFKHTLSLKDDGVTTHDHGFGLFKEFVGPCIVKIAFTAADNDTFGDASFDMVLVDNNI
jgi:hypothetical protein